MERQVEPELMTGEAQSLAYARANFEEPHQEFIRLFQAQFGQEIEGTVLDLGCGTGDITFRFAQAYPKTLIHGIDGSQAMLSYAHQDLACYPQPLQERIQFWEGILPEASLPLPTYDVIISNSLLHHLHHPEVLWQTLRQYAHAETLIFIMDLFRPATQEIAQTFVQTYAQGEPEILQRDFFNSLCAAFTVAEVKEQLNSEGFAHLNVKTISDRHLIIFGQGQ